MTHPTDCPRCGARLPRDGALRGLCPACILRQDAAASPEFVATSGEGPRPAPPDLSEIQRDFPQLEILDLVGRGGMGLVYKARQPRLDRLVALKVLHAELATDPAFAERFLREAQALAKLNHANVVTVHDFGECQGRYFLLMEFVDGSSLRQLLEKRALEPADALRLVPEICSGLQYAHEQGIVHRDIKPENILVGSDGHITIVDFGLVKLLDKDEGDWRLTRASQVMGTPQYMAPEQMHRPREVDHRADIYSLGVVLYEMLTAELPTGRFPLPSETVRVDVRLDEVVLKALEHEPGRRYQRAQEMGQRVEGISATERQDPVAAEPARAAGEPVSPGAQRAQREPGPAASEIWPRGRKISFRNEDKWGGFLVASGLLGVSGDKVVIEYRMRDCFELKTGGELQELEIDMDEIGTIEFKPGIFARGQLILTGTRMDFAGDFPQFNPGAIRLRLDRHNASWGRKFVRHVQALKERA